jgi:hypothetical protein
MAGNDFGGTIEVVRGQLSGERADQVLRFWSREGVLEGSAAEERLAQVACTLIDDTGEIAGVNSVFAADVPLIGGRRFWIYRSFLVPSASGAEVEMTNAAFTALEREFESNRSGPIGLCLLVPDPTEHGPEAIWPETQLMYAGYLEDGTQVRVRYFPDAAIGPGVPDSPTRSESQQRGAPIEQRYRLGVFDETDAVGYDDVLALWEREGVVSHAEAERRVHEVFLVAIDEAEGVVGLSSLYLVRNRQLRMDLWSYRIFVAHAHRAGNLALRLAVEGRDLLEQRFVSGEDKRAAGIVYEVEHEGLSRHFNRALWPRAEVTFIGESDSGNHVRVRYFRGALAPPPEP